MGIEAATRLGRYEVLKPLALGGMAEVLIARSTGVEGFERYVVIKRIRAEQARDPQYVKMFLDEARLAASLHHQNVVQVHDIGEAAGEYFFAMEYIHGEDLRRLLTTANTKKSKIPLAHVVTIVTGAAAGLHHAHEQRSSDRKPLNIVHRDVSPANIIVGYDGSVKVVDFGIAKAAMRSAETRSGTLKGKVSYMSPEQCIGNPVDRRSDVFALGIVLWELTTVRRLFKGQSDFMTMNAIVQGMVPKPSLHRPDIPAELETIILKALSPKPDDRYASCDELRRALEVFADHASLRTSTAALGEYLVSLLGERGLPWESEHAEVELEIVDVDFDGSEPLIVEPDVTSVLPLDFVPRPTSPFMRARAKEITGAQTPLPAAPVPIDPAAQANGWSTDKGPTTASGTPMAWVPVLPPTDEAAPSPKRSRKLVIGGAAVAAILIVVTIAVTRGGGTSQSASVPTAIPGETGTKGREPTTKTVDPARSQVGDAKAGDAKAGDAKAGDAKAGDAKAGDAKAGDAKAGDAKAGDAKAGSASTGSGDPEAKTDAAKVTDNKAGKPGVTGGPNPGGRRPRPPGAGSGVGSARSSPCPKGYDPTSLIPKCKT